MINIRTTVEVDADVDVDYTPEEFLDECTDKKTRQELFNILLKEFEAPFSDQFQELKPKTVEDEIKLKIIEQSFHKYSIQELDDRLR